MIKRYLDRKINLIYLIRSLGVGGAEKTMVRFLANLDRYKYDVTVIALLKGTGKLLPELKETGVKIEIINVRGKYDLIRAVSGLFKSLKKINPDILLCSLYHPTILGRFIGRLLKVPVIANWEVNEDFGGGIRILLNRITASFSDCIFCDSERVKNRLKILIKPSNDKIKVLYTGGLNLKLYKSHGARLDSYVKIGSVGRLVRQKGYFYLIEAAKIVTEHMDNIEFCIVGDGIEYHKLQNMVNQLGLSDKFRFLGFRDDIPEIISQWDIYVQPSLWEGLCITIIEAIAAGLPIVACDVGGISQSVIDGLNGFLVPAGDSEKLACKIIKLIKEADLRKEMGKKSREIAEENCSMDRMVTEIELALDELVKAKINLVWDQNASRYCFRCN